MTDRLAPLCDLLLGAAHADEHLHDEEASAVMSLLAELIGGDVPTEIKTRIDSFDPSAFDVAACAKAFAADDEADRIRVLHLVAAMQEADGEIDLREDEYLRRVAAALSLPAQALEGMAIEVEIEELRQDFARVRTMPPPVPAKAPVDIDVNFD